MGCQLCFLEELLKKLWGKQANVPLLAPLTTNCETLAASPLNAERLSFTVYEMGIIT